MLGTSPLSFVTLSFMKYFLLLLQKFVFLQKYHYLCKQMNRNFENSMKKIVFLFVTLWMCVLATMAVPAHPRTVQVRQPDGSYVTLRLVGNEWCHFQTTLDGYSVVKSNQGFYVYAEKKNGQLLPTSHVAHDVASRSADEQTFLAGVKKYQAPEMSASVAEMKARVEAAGAQRRAQGNRATDYSKFRGLIVLVQFNDKEFSRPDYKDIITDMVNKKDYTGFEGQQMTGSVRDYFSDNSDGKFQPQFDVVGPYTVDFSQYDCNMREGGKCLDILLAALDSADVDVNFKDYDGDGDMRVDLVFFVMAGNGANYDGNDENLWWPHRSAVYDPIAYNYLIKDGVILYDYASSVELAGHTVEPESIHIDGIGVICHEFSHVLGLPDFYDSNYEEDGQSITIGDWSLMDGGCYLNDSFTPAGYSLYERYVVGFVGDPQEIKGEGTYTLNPLHVNQTGFYIDSSDKNEFFILENRQNGDFKWDAYLPGHGMLVYRVDISNQSVWENNKVNAKAERNYYELVRACGSDKINIYTTATGYDPFPGLGKVTELHNGTSPANLKTWSGKGTKWGLFNIREENGIVSFDIQDALTLTGLSLPDSAEVGVGLVKKLNATPEPDYAECTLEWSSSNEDVATVDDDGVVKGISEGESLITAISSEGISASCVVTVKEVTGSSIAEFKGMDDQNETVLMLKDAEVLFSYQTRTYVRDSTGAIIFNNLGMTLKRNNRLSGLLYGKLSFLNNMPQFSPVAELTNLDNLEVTDGDQVMPHEKTLEDLSADDYADYVLVKGVKLVKDVFCYAVSGDRRIRVYTRFGTTGGSLPTNYDGKYYDVYAIFGTNRLNGQVIDELYIVKTPVEVEDPTGIVELRQNATDDNMPVYNLQGQRVSPTAKGLLIRDGRKWVNR